MLTDAWPADPEGAVLTPGGGRGAGVRSGAGGGEGGTDVGALDSFPILIVRPQSTAGCEAAQYSNRPPGPPSAAWMPELWSRGTLEPPHPLCESGRRISRPRQESFDDKIS